MVHKQPYGVVLGIALWYAGIISNVVPWLIHEREYPYILGIRGVALPLEAGNTTILKGSELSPKCF